MNYPEYIEINSKKYKINTDFRIGIECDRVANDDNIDDNERALAIIYLLFGKEALEDVKNHNELLKASKLYLNCGKEYKEEHEEADMDFIQDFDYIEASFMSDFHIDLEFSNMHWWKFIKLLNGLSNSETGNCCVLNNIRNLRNMDVSQIKDDKERAKILKAKQKVALHKKVKTLNEEQMQAMEEFNKLAGI